MEFIFGNIAALQHRDSVGSCFSGSVLGSGENVAPGQRNGDAGLLDRRGLLPALFKDSHKQVTLQAVILKLVSFCCSHILKKSICLPIMTIINTKHTIYLHKIELSYTIHTYFCWRALYPLPPPFPKTPTPIFFLCVSGTNQLFQNKELI